MRRWTKALAAAVLLACPVGLAAQAAPETPDGFQEAWKMDESWLVNRMKDEGIVGASVYVVHQGKVLERLEYGMADLATKRPVDDSTIFHWASITKTFTAVSLMQLRDRGRVSLDEPIVDHLPSIREVHDPYGSVKEITIRQLLSHSAGFRDPTWPWGGDEPWQPFEPTRWSQLVAMMPYTQILFPPGSRFRYSNPGLIFVGKVVEELSGDDIEVYVQKNIFGPLGMTRSYFDRTPYHLLKDRSNNYEVEKGEPVANGLDFDTGITAANSGLNAPMSDMVKWIDFLMGYGPGTDPPDPSWRGAKTPGDSNVFAPTPSEPAPGSRARPDVVLSRKTLEEMWTPVVRVEEEPDGMKSSGEEWMGLSFFLPERGGRTYVGHTGSQEAFRSFFYIDPATGTGVIGVFNTAGGDATGPDTDQLRVDVRERLFRDVFPLFVEK